MHSPKLIEFSSTAIHELDTLCKKTPYQALAYYYFNFGENEQSASTFLTTIIRQLCGARPDTPDWLKDLGARFRDKGYPLDLISLEDALWNAVAGFDAVYLIIDALDECSTLDNKRAILLKSLSRLHTCCPPNVHVMVTSRNEPDIEMGLSRILRSPGAEQIDLLRFREAVMSVVHHVPCLL